MNRVRLVFPEFNHPIIQEALSKCPDIDGIEATDLEMACTMVHEGKADALVAGIDYTSRMVILACRDFIGMQGKTFTSCFVFEKEEKKLIVADVATCKHPTEDQLYDIVLQTYDTAKVVLDDKPRVAMLSWSTLGSGGQDKSIDDIKAVIDRVKQDRPEIMIDGEMQLDAAVNPIIGAKKAPVSPVAGKANVLICPDLNSGNILYKSIEQFGGYTAAGPILQGFLAPASDLSRGSTVEDVISVIKIMKKIVEAHNG